MLHLVLLLHLLRGLGCLLLLRILLLTLFLRLQACGLVRHLHEIIAHEDIVEKGRAFEFLALWLLVLDNVVSFAAVSE